jgi:hypothetical protein
MTADLGLQLNSSASELYDASHILDKEFKDKIYLHMGTVTSESNDLVTH